MIKSLKDLQYLKYLNDVRFLVVLVIIVGGLYLMVKSPKIKTSMEVELYKTDPSFIKNDGTATSIDTIILRDTI